MLTVLTTILAGTILASTGLAVSSFFVSQN